MFTKWALDVLLILIFLLMVVIATQKGFVKSIWRTVTVIGSFVVAYIFGPVLGSWICTGFVLKNVTSYAYEVITRLAENSSGIYDVSSLFETLPEEFVRLLSNCGADINEISSGLSLSLKVTEDEIYSLAQSIAAPISHSISNAIGIVTVFLASVLVLILLGMVLKLVVKIPVIRSLDAILGAVFGIVEGAVIVCVLCVAIGIFVEHSFMNSSSNEVLYALTENSRIFNFFCQLSPIDFININVQ